MKTATTIKGTYGSHQTPTEVYTHTASNGLTWYVCHDSVNCNATFEDVEEGQDVELLQDVDMFTSANPILSEEEFLAHFEEEEEETPTERDDMETIMDSLTNGQITQARAQWQDCKDAHSTTATELYSYALETHGDNAPAQTIILFS